VTRCRICGEESRNGDMICPACRQGVKRTTPEEEIEQARRTMAEIDALGMKFEGMKSALNGRIETIRRGRSNALDNNGK